ncbi:hypothetical protein ONZ45_g16579 [Pleurotus djamor]|nr:hypothetical protein ONZ45_g16579 [Pleurotus djamor]
MAIEDTNAGPSSAPTPTPLAPSPATPRRTFPRCDIPTLSGITGTPLDGPTVNAWIDRCEDEFDAYTLINNVILPDPLRILFAGMKLEHLLQPQSAGTSPFGHQPTLLRTFPLSPSRLQPQSAGTSPFGHQPTLLQEYSLPRALELFGQLRNRRNRSSRSRSLDTFPLVPPPLLGMTMDTNVDPSGPPAGTAALNQPIDTSLPLSYNPDFAQLRETVERTQDDIADMKAMLQRLLLSSSPAPAMADPTTNITSASDPSAPGVAASMHAPVSVSSSSRLRPADPPIFDGSRENGHPFLDAVKLYIAVRPQDFPSKQTKIAWTLSWFQKGRAREFFHQYSRSPRQPYYANWKEFETDFRARFLPELEDEKARLRLESNLYHQGSRSYQEYYDSFVDLIDIAGYKDGPLIALKFRKGLSTTIQNHVAQSVDCPAMDDYKGWYKAAAKYARNQIANQSFNATTLALQLRSHPRPPPAAAPLPPPSVSPSTGLAPTQTSFSSTRSRPDRLSSPRTQTTPAWRPYGCRSGKSKTIGPFSRMLPLRRSIPSRRTVPPQLRSAADVEDSTASISRVEEVEEAPEEEKEEDFVPRDE